MRHLAGVIWFKSCQDEQGLDKEIDKTRPPAGKVAEKPESDDADTCRDARPGPNSAIDSDRWPSWRLRPKIKTGNEEKNGQRGKSRREGNIYQAKRSVNAGRAVLRRGICLSTGPSEHDFEHEATADISEE